jgi:hypothetical protein
MKRSIKLNMAMVIFAGILAEGLAVQAQEGSPRDAKHVSPTPTERQFQSGHSIRSLNKTGTPLRRSSTLPESSLQALGGSEFWVALLNGPGNGNAAASAIAVDSAGNSFVTGVICAAADQFGDCTDFSWETVKYDTNGNALWTASFDGVGQSFNYPSAIAVDAFGDAYVTGSICTVESCDEVSCFCGSSAYGTIKYDPNGAQLWFRYYGGGGTGNDAAAAIAIDPSANVYITGASYDVGGTPHYATLKYDSNGNEIWAARYIGPGNGPDYAGAVGLDPAGNVYVTGGSTGAGTSYDYATIKYDPNGNQLWVARYDGPASGDDAAAGLAVSSLGNVYVTGQSLGSTTSNDYATIKYDPNGNQLWVARYDGPASGDDFATAIALSSDEHVHVTGASSGSGTNLDYATIQYDSDGNEMWGTRCGWPVTMAQGIREIGRMPLPWTLPGVFT